RARTSTSREPAVCPTYSNVAGTDCGSIVTTETAGACMPACGCEFACWQPARNAAATAARSAPAADKDTAFPIMAFSFLRIVWFSAASGAHRGLRAVLAVLSRELLDQAVDAVVAHDFGEGVAIRRCEARARDLDVEHLPAPGGLLHLVVDR